MRHMLPVTEARFKGSRDTIVGHDGHVNAGSKKEAIQRLVEIANMITAGEIYDETAGVVTPAKKAENAATLTSAMHNPKEWAELGAAIALDIDQRTEREGFMRTVLSEGTVEEGSVPRIRVKQRNVTAIMSRGVAQIWPQYVRDNFIAANEFYCVATPRVELIELHQGGGDILEDKYFQALEAIFVQEDRTLVKMLRNADNLYNDVTYFSGSFSQVIFESMKRKVDGWGIPINAAIMAMDVMGDINAGTNFSSWFDPITKWEVIRTGRLGNLFGTTLLTDAFREPGLRVLDDGEVFVLGAPEYLGGYTDRGPVQSVAVDEFEKFVPARGWSMYEIIAMVVANGKAVARAKRS
jgi:hypothetical protein